MSSPWWRWGALASGLTERTAPRYGPEADFRAFPSTSPGMEEGPVGCWLLWFEASCLLQGEWGPSWEPHGFTLSGPVAAFLGPLPPISQSPWHTPLQAIMLWPSAMTREEHQGQGWAHSCPSTMAATKSGWLPGSQEGIWSHVCLKVSEGHMWPHSCPKVSEMPISQHLCQQWVFSLRSCNLMGEKWYFIMLSCTSLISKKVEYLPTSVLFMFSL